jgi:hypothetical protein
MTNKSLYNFCGWNDTKRVQQLLDTFDDIDILYENGSFFDFAISKGNVEICKALITYFENKQFPTKNTEYQEAKDKLIEILENATDSVDLSLEMKVVLTPYVNFESSEDDRLNDSFLDEIDIAFNNSDEISFNLNHQVNLESKENESQVIGKIDEVY